MILGAIIGACVGLAFALYQNSQKKKKASETLDENNKEESKDD